METIRKLPPVMEDSWIATLASLLPLWLLFAAVSAEGFPRPPVPVELAIPAFVLALVSSAVLLGKGWLEFDLVLYSFFPLLLWIQFDEISTAYKTPFLLMCALVLSLGIVVAKRSSSLTVRWLALACLAVITWLLASHAVDGYWRMVGDLVFGDCFPYTRGCPPLAGQEVVWWVIFFRP
jgi:hypothetical protein